MYLCIWLYLAYLGEDFYHRWDFKEFSPDKSNYINIGGEGLLRAG